LTLPCLGHVKHVDDDDDDYDDDADDDEILRQYSHGDSIMAASNTGEK